MSEKLDVIIIGAGSAGLSALSQVKKKTESYLLVDHGPLGTKCARVGCMPSKALIHVANECHRSRSLMGKGLLKADHYSADIPAVMKHVRNLRDHFAGGTRKQTLKAADGHFLEGKAEILSPGRIKVGELEYETSKIIIATGSRPVIPEPWKDFSDLILTSENIFEQEDFPRRIGVIGLGSIGLEIGFALSRLSIEVHGFSRGEFMGGLTDPEVNSAMVKAMEDEFSVHMGSEAEIENNGNCLVVKTGSESVIVDKIVAAVGAAPNLKGLGLENLSIDLDNHRLPPFDPETAQIGDLPIFIAGDTNGYSPILHEALDDGFIAGVNSMEEEVIKFSRRVNIKIVFSDPQIAVVGHGFDELKDKNFVTGKSDFEKQSRARMEGRNKGHLHIYADPDSAELLGAEIAVPDGEHLAHILALAMQNRMKIAELLQMPFYHPTVEEGLRSSLRDAMKKLSSKSRPGVNDLCQSCPEQTLT